MPQSSVFPRVLIADDERVIADSLALILSHNGYTTRAVYSGEKAVEAAEELRPDVLISDVVMGGISGIEAATAIRKRLPDCRIILISGQAATADLLKGAGTEARSFELLAKPIHPKAILDRLSDLSAA